MEETGAAHKAFRSAPYGILKRYIFSTDHKVIGIQYLLLALFSALLGTTLSILMRMNLTWPGTNWPVLGTLFPTGAPDGVMTPEFYLSTLTMHGTLMVFFVLSTAPQSAFGNYFLPIQVGASDMAFPVLNMLSFWTTLLSLLVLLSAFFVTGGPPIAGWTSYPTLSAIGEVAGPGMGMGQNIWIISIAIFCIATLFGSLNFITTFLNMRARGMSLFRLPLTCWAWFITSVLALLAFPVLLAASILLFLDRTAGTSFFVPAGLVISDNLLDHRGGSPILWQHLFWFFGHPEVYIAILPGMGATSHILSTFARKPVFGYRAMVYAMLAIGLLGFFVWGHHMFVSGISPYSSLAFSVLTLVIGVPSAIKTFNWLGTLWGGRIRFTSAMLFAIGFVSLFVAGGLTGLVLGQSGLDLSMHDTYFVLGHFHLVMGVAAVFGIFAATYFWFPKMFGRLMNEKAGKLHFYLTFIGVYSIFIPFHVMGIGGMPRRYSQFTEFRYLDSLQPLVLFVTIAAILTAAAQLIFVLNFFWSMFRGKRADSNPWEATTLEWDTSSPPPHDNFGGREVIVYRGPYEYSVPGHARDYAPQSSSNTETGE